MEDLTGPKSDHRSDDIENVSAGEEELRGGGSRVSDTVGIRRGSGLESMGWIGMM